VFTGISYDRNQILLKNTYSLKHKEVEFVGELDTERKIV